MLLNPIYRIWETSLNTGIRSLYTASVLEAARKGTRAKAEAKKKASKKVVVKKEFIPLKKRLELEKVGKISPRLNDDGRGYPVDDVYFRGDYKWQIFTVEQAVQMHRETQHPTQYNSSNADLNAYIELSVSADKKNQYIEAASNVVLLPHLFKSSHTRTILAICKDSEMVEFMKESGVTVAVGPEMIKMVEKGEFDLKQFDHIVCHSSLLPNLVSIRGMLRKQFPTPRNGTAGQDLIPLVRKFIDGIKYTFVKDKYDHDFASTFVKIGTLQMEPEQIEMNLKTLLRDVENQRPKTRTAPLITLVHLKCSSSRESFILDHNQYLASEVEKEKQEMRAS